MADEGMNNVQRHTARALTWIVGALREHNILYQVVGGLAARAYGANRPLADIDLYVPFDLAADLLGKIRPFVTWKPERYVDEAWDMTFLKLDLYGQWIELGDSSTDPRFFSAKNGCWERQHIYYANSTSARMFDIEIEVMPKDELIRYKSSLGREVDLTDIGQMMGASQPAARSRR